MTVGPVMVVAPSAAGMAASRTSAMRPDLKYRLFFMQPSRLKLTL